MIATAFIVHHIKRPSAQDTPLLLCFGITRIQVSQQAPERFDAGQLIRTPQAPCPRKQNENQRQSEKRSVDVGQEEGLGIRFIGEDRLRRSQYTFAQASGNAQSTRTLPRKFDVVHSTTTSKSRLIPSVLLATPIVVAGGGAVVVMVAGSE